MSRRRLHCLPSLACTLILGVLGGCQQQTVWLPPGASSAERSGTRPRPIVTDSPALARLQREQGLDGTLPWYADRRDYPLSTVAGYESPAYEVSATRSIDRRHESRGRVYDTSTQTTYRFRIQRQVD